MNSLVTGSINFGPAPTSFPKFFTDEQNACINGDHHKVYANYQLQTYPPQKPWICSKCGTEGTDFEKLPEETESFDDIKKRFGKT